ncbi:MAG: hypothetical protein ACR2NR_01680 [Solirubrobacteraceae bacterium]
MRLHLPCRAHHLARDRRPRADLVAVCAVTAVALAGCGSSSPRRGSSQTSTATAAVASTRASATGSTPSAPLAAAERPVRASFPAPRGRTLRQLSRLAGASVALGAATGSFTPGTRRFAFALTDSAGRFQYAPTALYIARSPDATAQGPFLAPADPMGVAPRYRSEENTGPGGIQAIYATQLPLPHVGTYSLLALTHTSRGTIGAPGELAVAAASPIPNVGQRPPAIATDTAASVHGDSSLLTTRKPPEQMASVSLRQALGRRPVALLFSTPQLCTSKVCGPVTDVAVSLQHAFSGRITFIHQEVYVNNNPRRGLRPALQAFHLRTEPWLFAINRRGIIVARLEGAFGVNELRAALQAALR